MAPQTHRLCTGRMAPNTKNTPSPEKPGTLSASLPATISVMPRSTTAKPTVVVIWMKCGWRRTGARVEKLLQRTDAGAECGCDEDCQDKW